MQYKMRTMAARGICILMGIVLLAGLSSCGNKIEERYIEAIEVCKNGLKDPASLRIYGDVLVVTFDNEAELICMTCDAKNGYGAYGGRKEIEIMVAAGVDTAYWSSDSESFLDARSLYEETLNLSKKAQEELSKKGTITFKEISGKAVAKAINAEYIPN